MMEILSSDSNAGNAVLAIGKYIMSNMEVLAIEQDSNQNETRHLKHAVKKTLTAVEKDEEAENRILVIKKKECKMKRFYDDVLPALEKAMEADTLLAKQVYSMTANGTVGTYKITKQREMKAATNRILEAAKKERFEGDCAIFSGKGKIREMKEAPLQTCYNAVMQVRELRGKAQMDAAGVVRIWPHGEEDHFFLVRMGTERRDDIIEEVIAAGHSSTVKMETYIEVGTQELKKKIEEDMKRSDNSLYEPTVRVRTDMMKTIGGRNQTKGDAKGRNKGKGKGGGKNERSK